VRRQDRRVGAAALSIQILWWPEWCALLSLAWRCHGAATLLTFGSVGRTWRKWTFRLLNVSEFTVVHLCNIQAYIHAFIHTFHGSISVSYGRKWNKSYTHKYTNLPLKYNAYFTKQYYKSSLHIKKSSTEYVCKTDTSLILKDCSHDFAADSALLNSLFLGNVMWHYLIDCRLDSVSKLWT
jgi:hypothetical protein